MRRFRKISVFKHQLLIFTLAPLLLCQNVSGESIDEKPRLTKRTGFATTEVLPTREWEEFTIDNQDVKSAVGVITTVLGQFQDPTELEDQDLITPGYLCSVIKNLKKHNRDIQQLSLERLRYYKLDNNADFDSMLDAFDSLDQSINIMLDTKLREVAWKPPSPTDQSQTMLGGSQGSPDVTMETISIGDGTGQVTPQNSRSREASPSNGKGNNLKAPVRGVNKRYTVCECTDRLIYFFKNQLLDKERIFQWIWEKSNISKDDVLINLSRPEMIRRSLGEVFALLREGLHDSKVFTSTVVERIINNKNLDPLLYPNRAKPFRALTKQLEDDLVELRKVGRWWVFLLNDLRNAIKEIKQDKRSMLSFNLREPAAG
ncbi:hypothetical protein ABW19_dt0209022 [Dactylella cylindrospora]|nr:hypothetical protein ABW19_dt0209022 [Dactylella cylindrospora]